MRALEFAVWAVGFAIFGFTVYSAAQVIYHGASLTAGLHMTSY